MRGGLRRSAARRGDLPLTAEINVTSLIDVAFTLLVIFIITAPALTGGLEVNLPEARTQPLTVSDESFIVSLDANGVIHIGETPVTREEFPAALDRLMDVAGARDIFLKADEAALYGAAAWLLGHLNEAARERGGRVGLVAEPEMRR
jgi:biopolymer transport protein ExbD